MSRVDTSQVVDQSYLAPLQKQTENVIIKSDTQITIRHIAELLKKGHLGNYLKKNISFKANPLTDVQITVLQGQIEKIVQLLNPHNDFELVCLEKKLEGNFTADFVEHDTVVEFEKVRTIGEIIDRLKQGPLEDLFDHSISTHRVISLIERTDLTSQFKECLTGLYKAEVIFVEAIGQEECLQIEKATQAKGLKATVYGWLFGS